MRLWGRGRYRSGYGNYNSGYSTEKTKVLEDSTVQIIPKHELEKYMPDISLGPKSLVTPISIMSARNGHRVTHDMLHSYDPHIGALEKQAVVDHDNITPRDDVGFVGLNAATLDCRGRIYRWLRRGPFFQEDHYFRRYVSGGLEKAPPQEISLFKRVVRLAGKGRLKAACEEYRKITTAPPVEVYRALTAACIPHGNLGDAVSIFEDGNSKLFFVARDGEVLHNLMSTAVSAKNRPRIMWVFNVMRGRFFENSFVRAEIDPLWQYRVTVRGLTWLLDNNCAEEARVLYGFLVEKKLLDSDLQVRLGHQMKDALAAGKSVALSPDALEDLSLMKAARSLAASLQSAVQESHESFEVALHEVPTPTRKNDSLQWLEQKFPDVDVLAVLRLARFRGRRDLVTRPEDQELFLQRCAGWLYTLSERQEQAEGKPLTYLRKSKPSAINENVRVAWIPELQKKGRLLPSEMNMKFSFKSGARFVQETFPAAGVTLASKFLAMQPIQTEVSAAIDFTRPAPASAPTPRLIHASISSEKRPLASQPASPVPISSGEQLATDSASLADKNTVAAGEFVFE